MRDGHAVFIVHLGDDGGGAAHRLVAEVHRAAGLQTADAVVVDDLQNLGLIEALHRLCGLVVVHQNDAALAQVDDVAAADHTAILAVCIQNGEIPVAHLCHHAGDVCHRGDEGELHDIVPGHVIGDGRALADELCRRVGIAGGAHDGYAGLGGNVLDGAAHLCAVADDDERSFLLDGAELAFVAVGQDDDITLFHAAFQHFRGGGANADVSGGALRVLAAHHHGSAQRFQNIAVTGAALGKDAGIEQVHVGGGDILHRDDTLQFVILAGHRKGVDLLVAHDLPRLAQAGGAGDAGHLPVIHVPDFRVDIGAHPGRRDPELFQHKFRFLIHFARTPGLADQITGLVFQLCIGNGRADGVGVRVAMPDDNDLMRSLLHTLPPYGSLPSYHLPKQRPSPAQRGRLQPYFNTTVPMGKGHETRRAVAFWHFLVYNLLHFDSIRCMIEAFELFCHLQRRTA